MILIAAITIAVLIHMGYVEVPEYITQNPLAQTIAPRRGGSRRNMGGNGHRRIRRSAGHGTKQASRRPEGTRAVTAYVTDVDTAPKTARTSMESAMQDAGIYTRGHNGSDYIVVSVSSRSDGPLATVYRRSSRAWRRARRFFQQNHPATTGSRVTFFGSVRRPEASPAPVPLGTNGVIVNPDVAVFHDRAWDGSADPNHDQRVLGKHQAETLATDRRAVPGYCERCDDVVDRTHLRVVTKTRVRQGRVVTETHSEGRCANCGDDVFRRGLGVTFEPRLRETPELQAAA